MWLHLWRTIPLMLVGLAFFLSWQVAGIVSFYIWQNTVPTVALIRGSVCGTYFVGTTSGTHCYCNRVSIKLVVSFMLVLSLV
jgi:hypothetical protein